MICYIALMFGDSEEHVVDGDSYEGSWFWYYAGTERIWAKACFDGEWSVFSDVQILTTTKIGELDQLTVTAPSELKLGQDFELSVAPIAHVKNYALEVHNGQGDLIYSEWSDEAISAVIDEKELDEGDYSIEVWAIGTPGWETSYYSAGFTVAGQRPDAPQITIENRNIAFIEEIVVQMSAENASKFRIVYDVLDEDGNYIQKDRYREENCDNGTATSSFSIGSGNCRVMLRCKALVGDAWSEFSETITVTVGASAGVLDMVEFTVSEEITVGNDIVVFVTEKENAEYYYLVVRDAKGEWIDSKLFYEPGEVTVSTYLEPGSYYITVYAYAQNWETKGSRKAYFTVTSDYYGICGEDITWSLSDNGVLKLSGSGEMYSYAEKSTPWEDQAVRTLVVSWEITQVDADAFAGAANLTRVFCYADSQAYAWARARGLTVFTLDENVLTLPAGTKTIESEAFAGLNRPVIVNIPSAVTTIAPDAFAGSSVAFWCAEGSPAAAYAAEHGIPIVPD